MTEDLYQHLDHRLSRQSHQNLQEENGGTVVEKETELRDLKELSFKQKQHDWKLRESWTRTSWFYLSFRKKSTSQTMMER